MIDGATTTYPIIRGTVYLLRYIFNWKRILHYWPKRRIVLYGESGAGKTQFIHSLRGDKILITSRTDDIRRYEWILPDFHRVELIDTPGHMSLKEIRQRLDREFVTGKIYGVINIVTNGYLINTDADLSKVFSADNPSQVKPKFLQENLERELKQVDEWIENIHADNNVKWFMTVVNKADIWYDSYEQVMDYYRCKAYYAKIQALHHCCKKLVTFPYCSIISPFGGRPMLLSMSEHRKWEMADELLEEIRDLNFG